MQLIQRGRKHLLRADLEALERRYASVKSYHHHTVDKKHVSQMISVLKMRLVSRSGL